MKTTVAVLRMMCATAHLGKNKYNEHPDNLSKRIPSEIDPEKLIRETICALDIRLPLHVEVCRETIQYLDKRGIFSQASNAAVPDVKTMREIIASGWYAWFGDEDPDGERKHGYFIPLDQFERLKELIANTVPPSETIGLSDAIYSYGKVEQNTPAPSSAAIGQTVDVEDLKTQMPLRIFAQVPDEPKLSTGIWATRGSGWAVSYIREDNRTEPHGDRVKVIEGLEEALNIEALADGTEAGGENFTHAYFDFKEKHGKYVEKIIHEAALAYLSLQRIKGTQSSHEYPQSGRNTLNRPAPQDDAGEGE